MKTDSKDRVKNVSSNFGIIYLILQTWQATKLRTFQGIA